MLQTKTRISRGFFLGQTILQIYLIFYILFAKFILQFFNQNLFLNKTAWYLIWIK